MQTYNLIKTVTIIGFFAIFLVAYSQANQKNVMRIPCRNMGDGRILVDSGYLPKAFKFGKSTYDIMNTGSSSSKGEWANLVCTISIKF
jgi:hypothetical protein